VRPDGRSLQEFRPVSINVGSIKTAEGSAIVKIGNTVVVCGIKAVSGVFIMYLYK
jgi:RNase PH-related exoribonuclease